MKQDAGYMKQSNRTIRIIVLLILIIIAFRFVIFIGYVPSSSMEPTLKTGSYNIVYTLPYKLGDPMPERGDIICFNSEAKDGSTRILVKRVIGIEGDVLNLNNGVVFLNGELLDEPYLSEKITLSHGQSPTYTVPEGCVFVLGDNRTHSNDSRFWDDPYVKASSIKGIVLKRH